MEYLEKIKEASKSKFGESVIVDSLKTRQKGRPLLLGEELDAALFNGYCVRIPTFLFTCQRFSHKRSPNITVHMKASDARIHLVHRHIKLRDSTKALPPILRFRQKINLACSPNFSFAEYSSYTVTCSFDES